MFGILRHFPKCYCGSFQQNLLWRAVCSEVTDYADIIIVGGGMVGTSLACAFGHSKYFQDKKLLLLETNSKIGMKDWNNSVFENRVSAITPASRKFLEEVGVWELLEKKRYNRFNKMQVWDSCSTGAISFDAADVDMEDIAYIVENSVIESCIQKANEFKQLSICYKTAVDCIDFTTAKDTEELVTVHLQSGESIQTKLLLGVDGFNSIVRKNANIETIDYDYEQCGVVSTLKISSQDGVNETAWQRFLPSGPIALLPLSHDYSSLVWSTSQKESVELINMSDEQFVSRVNDAFNANVSMSSKFSHLSKAFFRSTLSILQPGRYASNRIRKPPTVDDVVGPRGSFPLALKHSPKYVKSRMALVGDSAHRIHPMAGQGVNLGFGDARCLLNVVEDAMWHGEDYGTLENLLPYETQRQRKVLPVMLTIQGLNHLFSTDSLPVVFTRTFGLHLTDSLPVIKNQIVKQAMS